uniref:VQ domain-containing protein n=1 Tax=Aegilops tauschii subsp. strangulata TaxID=200361 RepID=A0A452ZZ42_AEGTS
MSTGEEQRASKPPATVRIVETLYVEAGTAADFKSVVQRLTGRDSASAAALPVQDRTTPQGADRGAGAGGGGGASDAKRGS